MNAMAIQISTKRNKNTIEKLLEKNENHLLQTLKPKVMHCRLSFPHQMNFQILYIQKHVAKNMWKTINDKIQCYPQSIINYDIKQDLIVFDANSSLIHEMDKLEIPELYQIIEQNQLSRVDFSNISIAQQGLAKWVLKLNQHMAKRVPPMITLTGIKQLSLANCRIVTCFRDISQIMSLPLLEELNLSGNCVQTLRDVVGGRSIQKLHLGRNTFHHKDLIYLWKLPLLRCLDLTDNVFDYRLKKSSYIEQLSGIVTILPQLKRINLLDRSQVPDWLETVGYKMLETHRYKKAVYEQSKLIDLTDKMTAFRIKVFSRAAVQVGQQQMIEKARDRAAKYIRQLWKVIEGIDGK